MDEIFKLKYVDHRKIFLPRLKFYPNGKVLPEGDNIIKVTESEKVSLLKQFNGRSQCYELVRDRTHRAPVNNEE